MTTLSKPTHVVALGINGACVYYGMKKGGWWYLLVAVGLYAGLYNVNALTAK